MLPSESAGTKAYEGACGCTEIAQSAWNPRKWDPRAESEMKSEEEVELFLQVEGTSALRISWL